ncbi:uncharacterized protein LOC107372076 [Tetranychus urticae]|uniref:uncharacterized protein LOC107372076 n=1 Tax=Tetranychus urticae TaxID=32264 RepID=UPI00077BF62B|nr:uncharacterized protein LOC107372076 [Tetranychus urticae]
MNQKTFTLFLLIFVISLAQRAPDIRKIFIDFCALRIQRIKEGTFDENNKATNDCREKMLTKDEIAIIAKCERILRINEADQVTEICADFNGIKGKFTELVRCIKQDIGSTVPKFYFCEYENPFAN